MPEDVKLPLGKDGQKNFDSKPDDEKQTDPSRKVSNPDNTNKPDAPTIDNDNQEGEEKIVSVDEKDYKLDKDGNALKDDGTVFMTKEELEALETSASDDNGSESSEELDEEELEVTIEDIEKASGIELRDQDGEKVKFDFTLEGLAKREKLIKDTFQQEGEKSAINKFFKSNPDLYKAYIYKQKQGTLDGFTNQPYYKSIDVNKDDEQQLKQFIIEAEIKRGKTSDAAKRYAEYCKAENILEEEGINAHKALVELEEKEETFYKSSIESTKKAQLENEKKLYGTYYDESGKEVIVDTPGSIYNKVVTKGQIGNLVIPQEGISVKDKDGNTVKVNRREIFDYVATPVRGDKFNRSQAQIDLDAKLSDVDYMLRSYMMNLTGNDLSVFLERQELESKSKNIKRKLKTSGRVPQDVNKNTGIKKLKVPVK